MRKAIVTLFASALLVVPFASPAQANCPDPDNPCTPQTIDPIQELKDYYCKIKGC